MVVRIGRRTICFVAATPRPHDGWKVTSILPQFSKTLFLLWTLPLLQLSYSIAAVDDGSSVPFVQELNFTLLPSISDIVFFQHTLEFSGIIDLSQLQFQTIVPNASDADDLDNITTFVDSIVNVVEFHVSHFCNDEQIGCGEEWSITAGVGVMEQNANDVMHWCCTTSAIEQGLCTTAQKDQLIVDLTQGTFHRVIAIPSHGNLDTSLRNAKLSRDSGNYVIIIANCNPNGRPIQVTGSWSVVTTSSTSSSDGNNSQQQQQQHEDHHSSPQPFEEELDLILKPSPLEVRFFQHIWPTDGTFDMSNVVLRTIDDSDTMANSGTITPSVLDVVEFHVIHHCPNMTEGCGYDWSTSMGIGAVWNGTKDTQFCCTAVAIQKGLCEAALEGQLILLGEMNNHQGAEGGEVFHRTLDIPIDGPVTSNWNENSKLFRRRGIYIVLLANCNPQGRPIHVSGSWDFVPAGHVQDLPAPTPPISAPSPSSPNDDDDEDPSVSLNHPIATHSVPPTTSSMTTTPTVPELPNMIHEPSTTISTTEPSPGQANHAVSEEEDDETLAESTEGSVNTSFIKGSHVTWTTLTLLPMCILVAIMAFGRLVYYYNHRGQGFSLILGSRDDSSPVDMDSHGIECIENPNFHNPRQGDDDGDDPSPPSSSQQGVTKSSEHQYNQCFQIDDDDDGSEDDRPLPTIT